MLHNLSPWQAQIAPVWLQNKQQGQVIVIKQSYEYDHTGQVIAKHPCDEIIETDEFTSDQANSLLLNANEMVPFKQGFEMYGNITAYPPKGTKARVIEAALQLHIDKQPVIEKQLRITGKRQWRRSLLGPVASDPQILTPVALNYEHCFGGTVHKSNGLPKPINEKPNSTHVCAQNPIGQGYKLKNKHANGQYLPQVEYANQMIKKPSHSSEVASLSAIPMHWSPRVELQPEVDKRALMLSQYPYTKPLHDNTYNYAPEDQRVQQTYSDNWRLTLSNLYPELLYNTPVVLKLPYQKPLAAVQNKDKQIHIDLQCDTLVIEGEKQCFSLLWRGQITLEKLGVNSKFIVAQQSVELGHQQSGNQLQGEPL